MVNHCVKDRLTFRRWALVAWGILLGCCYQSCGAENEAAIKEFGVEKSKPINSGFFFYKHAYVDSPYVVERRGLDILINGILIRPGVDWPQPKRGVKDDPGDPPPGCNPWHDPTNYLGRKWVYLSGKYDLKQARRLMVQLLKTLPDVKDAALRPGYGEDIVALSSTKEPGERLEAFNDSWKEDTALNRGEVLEASANSFKIIQNTLRTGCFLWEVELGGELTLGPREALTVLGVMFSEGDVAEKTKQLEKQRVLIEPEMAKLVTECPHSEQLAKRYERLKKGEPEEELPELRAQAGDVQPERVPQSKAVPYPWLGGGLAFAALVAALLLWRLRRR